MKLLNGILVGAGDYVVDGRPQLVTTWVKNHKIGDFMVSTDTGTVYELVEKPGLFKIAYISAGEKSATDLHVGSIFGPEHSKLVQNVARVNKFGSTN